MNNQPPIPSTEVKNLLNTLINTNSEKEAAEIARTLGKSIFTSLTMGDLEYIVTVTRQWKKQANLGPKWKSIIVNNIHDAMNAPAASMIVSFRNLFRRKESKVGYSKMASDGLSICPRCGESGEVILGDVSQIGRFHNDSGWAKKNTIITCTGYALRQSCGAQFCLNCAKKAGGQLFACPNCGASQIIPRDAEIIGNLF